VKEVVQYELPYLKEEIMAIFQYLKDNKQDILNFSKNKNND